MTLPKYEDNQYKNKVILFACKKYIKNKKNRILILNIKNNGDFSKINNINDFINYYFINTNNFEVYCFCQLVLIENIILLGDEKIAHVN